MKKLLIATMALALASCAPNPQSLLPPTPSPTLSATTSQSPSATPTQSATPTPEEATVAAPSSQPPRDPNVWLASDGPATWVCRDEKRGILYSFEVPLNSTSTLSDAAEALRIETGVSETPRYLQVTVDASRVSNGIVRVRSLYLETESGKPQTATPLKDVIADWAPSYDEYLTDQAAELKKLIRDSAPEPGGLGEEVLVLDEELDSIVEPKIADDAFQVIPCTLD